MKINLDPKIWGPKAWFFLESICITYPEFPTNEEKDKYKSFFYSLINILPCKLCNNHYLEFINKNPLTDKILSKRENVIKWILKCHNNINTLNKKKNITLDNLLNYYDEVYNNKLCNDKCSNSNINNNANVNIYELINSRIFIFLFCIIIIIILIMNKYNNFKKTNYN